MLMKNKPDTRKNNVMAKQETQKSLVVVATIVLATNIVCRLFKSMYEREKN